MYVRQRIIITIMLYLYIYERELILCTKNLDWVSELSDSKSCSDRKPETGTQKHLKT